MSERQPLTNTVSMEVEARKVAEAIKQVHSAGANLVSHLEDYTKAGGDPHETVQALELFIRAVVRDCMTRLEQI